MPQTHILVNPLNGKGSVNWLHLAIQVEPTFLISDIQALWRNFHMTCVCFLKPEVVVSQLCIEIEKQQTLM